MLQPLEPPLMFQKNIISSSLPGLPPLPPQFPVLSRARESSGRRPSSAARMRLLPAAAVSLYLRPVMGTSLGEGAALTTPHWLVSVGGSGLGLMAMPAAKVGGLLLLGTTCRAARHARYT